MARHQAMRAFALALCLLAPLATPALAQKDKKADADQDVMSRERNVKTEKSKIFQKWLNEDVSYIISPEEKAAFEKLATDEEREQFIEQFWLRRDDDRAIVARVDLAELTGSETFLHLSRGGRALVAQVPGVHPRALGSECAVYLSLADLYGFGGDGRLLFAPADAA